MIITNTGLKEPLSWPAIFGVNLFLIGIFGFSDLYILSQSLWPHLYGITSASITQFEEVVIYLPFAHAVGTGNLLPIAPAFDPALGGLSVYPVVTNLIQGFILSVISGGHIDLFVAFMHIVVPIVCFWLLFHIFRLYIGRTWSLVLALLSVTYHTNFHFIAYYVQLLGSLDSFVSNAPILMPEISRYPFPGISLLMFLIPFYLTLRQKTYAWQSNILLSILWAVQIHVYLFNYIAGAMVYVSYVAYLSYGEDSKRFWSLFISRIALTIGLFALFLLPYLFEVNTDLARSVIDKSFTGHSQAFEGNNWGILPSYLLPSALLIVSIFLFRADYREFFLKFTPILIVAAVDITIGLFQIFSPLGNTAELYYHRISSICFRFFYFIPFLYFCSLQKSNVILNVNDSLARAKMAVKRCLGFIFYQQRHGVALVFSLLVGLGLFAGSLKRINHHNEFVESEMQVVEHEVNIAKELALNGLVAFDRLETNLLAPALMQSGSVLISSFGNYVGDDLVKERIVLFAKLKGWELEQLRSFVSRSGAFNQIKGGLSSQEYLRSDIYQQGLGYWLVNHKRVLSDQEYKDYIEEIERMFKEIELETLAEKHELRAFIAKNNASFKHKGFRVQVLDNNYNAYIYEGKLIAHEQSI